MESQLYCLLHGKVTHDAISETSDIKLFPMQSSAIKHLDSESYVSFKKKKKEVDFKPHNPQNLEFMNLNGLLHSCCKNFNYLTNCKHMLQKERKKKHLHSSSDGFDVWPQNPDHFVNCRRLRSSRKADTHTQSGPGLICGDHCTDPDQIRCQSTKLPSFPLVVAEWEQRQPPTS